MKKTILYILSFVFVFFPGCEATRAQAAPEDTTCIDHTIYQQRVLSYSKEIMQSTEQKIAMSNAMKFAKTNFLPRLDFSGQAQYRINDYNMDFAGYALDMAHESYTLGAQLSQVIYNGGAVKNAYRAAQIKDSIAGKTEELTWQNIIYAAQVNYWSTVAKKELYLTMCRYVEIISSLADVLKIRYKDGLIAKTDYLQTLSRLKEAAMNQSDAYKAYQLALQNLNIMMGENPLKPIDPADSINLSLPMLSYTDLEQALSQRPDYRISQLNVSYQEKQLNLVKSDYNPQLSVGLQQTWGTSMLNFTGETMFNTNAFAQLSIPIFAWGARYKKVNSQKAIINSTDLDRQIILDNISKEVSNSWTEYVENTRQIKMARDAKSIAEENLELNTFSYTEGKLTILDVLSSQLTWIQAQSKYISTLLQQKISRAAYLKATGGIH